MIGKAISHYRILEKLGEGGMGIVYKAEDTKLKRIVALKFLPRHIAASAEERERFKIEAQAAAALNHPNIATIYAIEEVDGEIFIVMEFIEGEELKKKVASDQLPVSSVIDIAIQIAEGLKAAHAKGIIHRDIKSSNIMVTESGQVKIMDFGLAKINSGLHLTKSGMTLGTAAYMSPEQARGEQVDHRTDIWSLGIVLYEMITGQLPFHGEYEQAIMYAIVNEAPEPLSRHRAEVSIGLQHIIDKALDKNPETRYRQIEDMLPDLKSPTEARASSSANKIKPNLLQRRRTFLYGGIAAFLILLIAGGLYFFSKRSKTFDAIAVLPLANLSGDPQQEYFADGMTEAVITELAKVKALRVISRTSVMQFKNTTKSLPEIARQLNVDAIVEGSVVRSGDRVQITAQLIEAKTDQHLWADSYERDLREVLTLQRQVALAITHEIQIKLTPQEQARLQEARAVDPEAYKHYLWGLSFWDKQTKESMQQALNQYEQAIAIDSNFAQAYAAVAVPYLASAVMMRLLPLEEAEVKARQAAMKALELDETLSEAHSAMAVIRKDLDGDWSGAEEEFKRAIELNPGNAEAHREYGWGLFKRGRTKEGLAEMIRAFDLNPLSESVNAFVAWAYVYDRQYDEAIAHCLKALQLNPNFPQVQCNLGMAYFTKGLYDETIATLQKVDALALGRLDCLGYLGSAYALSGQRERALKLLEELKERLERGEYTNVAIAQIYVSLHEKEKALTMLERNGPWLVVLILSPVFDPLHSEPRFQALLKKLELEN